MKITHTLNKNTCLEVCDNYKNKKIREIRCDVGKELKVVYEDGGFFTHEEVFGIEFFDGGFWIETTKKLWKIIY